MKLLLCMIIFLLILVAIYLDLSRKIDLTHKSVMSLWLILLPHTTLVIYFFIRWQILLVIGSIIFCSYLWLKVNILPHTKKQLISKRLRLLIGGKRLVLYALYSTIAQALLYTFARTPIQKLEIPMYILVTDIVIMVLSIVFLYLNGMLRILLTSKRLNIFKKLIIYFTMLLPVVNIIVIIYVCSVANSEYEHECYKVVNQNMQIDSAICKTKYPLVLIHGVGFRDFKYINYWGRIPKELMRHSATVYYGNQEAWGTIEYNAQDIKNKILDIVQKTGCEKVNILAHSKGGLDARYMISSLDMGDYVASLTLISTPNQGSEIIDILYKLPKKLFKLIGACIDRYFRLLGDKNPDFFVASHQLSTLHSEKFNKEVINHEQVYYQSYMTIMNHMFSDYVLTLPYLIIKLLHGHQNDGLITVDSAKWGVFKGVLKNPHSRGISHGDIIDLRKDDYKGFDVREKYVEIVADLKNNGY